MRGGDNDGCHAQGRGHRCGTALENGDFEKESVRVVDGGAPAQGWALAASRDIGLLTRGWGVTRGTSLISIMSVGECSLEIYDDVVQGIERRTL